MQELLEREFDRFLDDLKKRLEAARSLEDIVRIFVTKNFDEVDRGSAIQILRGQPDIRETIRKKEKKRNAGSHSIWSPQGRSYRRYCSFYCWWIRVATVFCQEP
jgi:hypothetical protein